MARSGWEASLFGSYVVSVFERDQLGTMPAIGGVCKAFREPGDRTSAMVTLRGRVRASNRVCAEASLSTSPMARSVRVMANMLPGPSSRVDRGLSEMVVREAYACWFTSVRHNPVHPTAGVNLRCPEGAQRGPRQLQYPSSAALRGRAMTVASESIVVFREQFFNRKSNWIFAFRGACLL